MTLPLVVLMLSLWHPSAVPPCEEVLRCSCLPQPPVAEALQDASAVFRGVVRHVAEERLDTGRPSGRRVTFEVSRTWKGAVGEVITVGTGTSSADCGYDFEVGREYVVYAHGDDQLSTSICTRTRTVGAATEDLRLLGAGQRMK
jgi:hypothetical protein